MLELLRDIDCMDSYGQVLPFSLSTLNPPILCFVTTQYTSIRETGSHSMSSASDGLMAKGSLMHQYYHSHPFIWSSTLEQLSLNCSCMTT